MSVSAYHVTSRLIIAQYTAIINQNGIAVPVPGIEPTRINPKRAFVTFAWVSKSILMRIIILTIILRFMEYLFSISALYHKIL